MGWTCPPRPPPKKQKKLQHQKSSRGERLQMILTEKTFIFNRATSFRGKSYICRKNWVSFSLP